MKTFTVFCVVCILAMMVKAESEVDRTISADPKPDGDLIETDLIKDELNKLKDVWDWKNEGSVDQAEVEAEKSAAVHSQTKRVKRNIVKVVVEGAKFIGRQLAKVPKTPPKVPNRLPQTQPKVPNRLPPSRGTGPSGKPNVHNQQLPNRKTAQEAAREAGKGNPPIHHGPSNNQNPHWHPADKAGNKLPDGSHYSYPKKG